MSYGSFSDATHGKWAYIFEDAFVGVGVTYGRNPSVSGWINCRSPIRHEKTPSFGFNVNNGGWIDQGTSEKGNGVQLLSRLLGLSDKEAMDYARRRCSNTTPTQARRNDGKADAIQDIIKKSAPKKHSDLAWQYLKHRGLSDESIARLEYVLHPERPIYSDGKVIGRAHSMVFKFYKFAEYNDIDDTTGEIIGRRFKANWTGLHETYITSEGRKVDFEIPRRTWGLEHLDGSYIRLWAGPDKTTLACGEGIETSSRWAEKHNYQGILIACGNSSLLKTLRLAPPQLQQIQTVHVLGDNDRSFGGQAAAFYACQYFRSVKRRVIPEIPGYIMSEPPEGTKSLDWADD